MTSGKYTGKRAEIEDRRLRGRVRERHGMSTTANYKRWQGMINRCYLPDNKNYEKHGAKGVRVCRRWRDSFLDFYSDLGSPPSPGMSMDRIDGCGHYSCGQCDECAEKKWPLNVRWATHREQNINRKSVKWITYDGRTQCLSDWAKESGQTVGAFAARLAKGWTMEAALHTPKLRTRSVTFNGKTQSIRRWAEETGISEKAISVRLRNNWTVERALTEPSHGPATRKRRITQAVE